MTNNKERIFVIHNQRIMEDDSTRGKSVEDVTRVLRLQYPEVANATVEEQETDDALIVTYKPKAGRKG